GPRSAHKLLRENQLSSLFVVGRDQSLHGVVYGSEVAEAVRNRADDLKAILHTDVSTVAPDVALADLFTNAAQSTEALPVVGDGNRLVGVIPLVTLLNALASGNAETTNTDPPAATDDSSASGQSTETRSPGESQEVTR